jgi:hypothetical protein
MKTYLYAIAEIHLFPEAALRARLPLDYTVCTPVKFQTHPDDFYSLWIVPDQPLVPCRQGRAKVALLFDELASRLLFPKERFTIWFGDKISGDGEIIRVYQCDLQFYEATFHF